MFDKLILAVLIILAIMEASDDLGMICFAIGIYCIIALFAYKDEADHK